MSLTARRSVRRYHRRISARGWILLAVLVAVVRTWPLYSALVAGLVALTAVAWAGRRGHRWWSVRRVRADIPISIRAYETATPGEFEHQVAALCRRDGCTDVRVVGGGGDLAADVLAKLPGRGWWQVLRPRRQRILIQAKRYGPNTTVRSEHVQMVNGTYRDIHHCDVAAIVTTSSFTRDARNLADRLGIARYDNTRLARWASGTGPAPWA